MALQPTPGLLRTVECVVLLLGGLGLWAWLFMMPDFHNAFDYGLDSVMNRSGVFLFGVPLLGTAQLFLALGLWRGWGGAWLPVVALLVAGVDALAAVGAVALVVALSSFHMH
jgi:hypothetical protein